MDLLRTCLVPVSKKLFLFSKNKKNKETKRTCWFPVFVSSEKTQQKKQNLDNKNNFQRKQKRGVI